MNKVTACCLSLCITGIASISQAQAKTQNDFMQSYSDLNNVKAKHIPMIYQAEKNSTPAGKAVLREARKTALEQRKIIKGSCWDYLDYVFKTAGFPNTTKNREIIFKGKYPSGPFINTDKIQSGDWIYHINHSYNDIEHSGMFVGWVDKANNTALMFSYVGEHRGIPGRYSTYDLSHVYNVMRPSFGDTKPTYEAFNPITKPVVNKPIVNKPVAKPITNLIKKPTVKPIVQPIHISDEVTSDNYTENEFIQKYRESDNINRQYLSIIYQAEENSCGTPLKILRQARKMTLDTKDIVVGTSENYIRELFDRVGAGYTDFLVGNQHKGHFINPHKVESGDWLSFINHGYNDLEHSGIFVGWIDKSKNTALILSYSGEGNKKSARYRAYDISHIYNVKRPSL